MGELIPMTKKDLTRLADLEDIIKRHLVGFTVVGKALFTVKHEALYREGYATFEEWCQKRFNIGRRRAYELLAATDTIDVLVRHGACNLPANERQVRPLTSLPEDDKTKVWLEAVADAGADVITEKHVRRAVREHNRQVQLEKLKGISEGNKPLGLGKRFPVILSDPPWQYSGGTADPSRQIENQYPTMDLESICELPVGGELATDDAVLFLWATAPLLPDALAVMESWDFTYKTHAVWDKQKIGMGYWLRGQHELLLIGVRGNPPKPAPRVRASSMIDAPRGNHSAKPVKVYELIESYYPDLPRVEMFAIDNKRPGWSGWGNQA